MKRKKLEKRVEELEKRLGAGKEDLAPTLEETSVDPQAQVSEN